MTVSQAQGERRDTVFDGRIRLHGDAAPELEVIVELDDRFLILGHSSGELGRWEKDSVQVAPIGRGWFAFDIEEEQVTFLPRRPGHFAAATVDLVPVEETKKGMRRKARAKKLREVEALTANRKGRKRLRRDETSRATLAPAEPPTGPAPPADPVGPVDEPGSIPHPVERAPGPVELTPARVRPVPVPTIRPPNAAPEPPVEPASPWDDLPVPDIPPDRPRDKRRLRSTPYAPPRRAPEKQSGSPREKAPKPPRGPRAPRGQPVELSAGPRTIKQARPLRKKAFSRVMVGFWHGLKGIALRISDELRQTGIVPFDRLPAAPARVRPNESHEHVFQEHRLPGGLTRNVCHSCGLVSIGESREDV